MTVSPISQSPIFRPSLVGCWPVSSCKIISLSDFFRLLPIFGRIFMVIGKEFGPYRFDQGGLLFFRSVTMSSWYPSLRVDGVHSGVGLLARSKAGSSSRQQCPHAAISLSPLSHHHDYFGKSWSSSTAWKCGDFTAKSTQLSSLHWQRSDFDFSITLLALDFQSRNDS